MGIFDYLSHLFLPRSTNNHKARLLHISSITTYIVLLLVFQVFLTGLARFRPDVLGYASNITVADLLKYTNEKRVESGQKALSLNDQLSTAAEAKAADMFAKGYWAHTAPDGKDPWSFISAAGYNYLFAGENLARDFGDSRSVVNAWMNSASHKENLLNPRYQEIGFAVVNGKYNGYETTLVVQMFGAKSNGAPTVEAPKAAAAVAPEPPAPAPSTPGAVLTSGTRQPQPGISAFGLTKGVSIALVAILSLVLVADGFLAYRRKTVRLSGHNFAHLIFLVAVLVALNLLGRGIIL
jgi:hypothetical protein